VAEYPSTRYSSGTDRGYPAGYGETRDAPGIPWAILLPAVLSDTPVKRETPASSTSRATMPRGATQSTTTTRPTGLSATVSAWLSSYACPVPTWGRPPAQHHHFLGRKPTNDPLRSHP